MAVLAAVLAVSSILGAGPATKRQLPDARTWQFFSEKKIRSRLFFVVPGSSDSILVSDEPACCQEVSPNGRWVACTNFNRKAVENELLLLSRELDRWRPLPGYTAITYEWSPDGLRLAGYGKRRTASSVCFFAVDPIARSAWITDSMTTLKDYEFAWDSTSHRVAICRPGSGKEEPSRVLLLSMPDRKTSTVATLRDGTPSSPRWLPDGVLVVTKEPTASGGSSVDLRFPLPER
jgi:Tol biopolymer transport system component